MTPTLHHPDSTTSATAAASPATTTTAAAKHVVASYPTYAAAEQAVDYLSDHQFPVQHVAIVGRGLHLHEQITGRMSWAKAAGEQALRAAVLGALFGWVLGVFNLIDPLVSGLLLAVSGAVVGAVIGALLGLIGHALPGGRRDFASISTFRADSYDLLVDQPHTDHATWLLATPGAPSRHG